MKSFTLHEYISQSRYNHKQVAEIIGVTPQQFYWMIKNPKKLRPDQIKAIADAIDRSPRNLFSLIINN